MKKQYLFTFLSLTFVFMAFSSVFANDLRQNVEDRMAKLESHREELKLKAEKRRAEAEARGDEIQAKREQMKLDLEARWAEMDARREAKKAEIEARRASSTAKRIEFQQEIAKRKVERVTKVMLATIERLEKIIVRIESRIAKIKTRGGDTTESEKFVAEAKTNLSDARVKVGAFAGIDLSSAKAAENFERIRAAAAAVREIIRTAHENLMMAVRSLRYIETDAESGGSGDAEQQ
ncbi:MAG: hypothetical protein HYX23_01800 [Candidatus Zambryskibacteria bacterium]|nr:hypothetical protein [Candidatus Zambryskibacteria bacterium]